MEIHFGNVCVHVSLSLSVNFNMFSLGVTTNKALIGALGFLIQTWQKLCKFYSIVCLQVLETFSFSCTIIDSSKSCYLEKLDTFYVSLCFSYMKIIGGWEFCRKIKQDWAVFGYNQRTYQRYHWTGTQFHKILTVENEEASDCLRKEIKLFPCCCFFNMFFQYVFFHTFKLQTMT